MSVLLQSCPGDAGEPVKDFRDTNLPLVILEEVRSVPLQEKEGILAWKKSQQCHGERQQHRFFSMHTK